MGDGVVGWFDSGAARAASAINVSETPTSFIDPLPSPRAAPPARLRGLAAGRKERR